jgi:phage gpG-like protein
MSKIIGEDQVVKILAEVGKTGAASMRLTMNTIGLSMSAYVKINKLSGQALHRRTGNLSRSITSRTTESGGAINAIVGTNASYARAHEFGAHETVNVPAYVRMQTMAWGRAIDPKQVTVRAHPMKQNIPEASFLRSTLRETKASSLGRIKKTMRELLNP